MNKINEIKKDLSDKLSEISLIDGCDLSDLGNEIGIIIAESISSDMGYELDSFLHGIKHGVSLIDGTH